MHFSRRQLGASSLALTACLSVAFSAGLVAGRLAAVEQLEIRQGGKTRQLEGRVVVEAADGGLLLMDGANTLWTIQPDDIQKRESNDEPFRMLPKSELKAELLSQLPSGFRVHETAHYMIAYNTSSTYAEWCGALYERLYSAFTNYWKNRDFVLHEPESPLVALVFGDKASYSLYAREELGDATGNIIGYYSLRTNRVTMYDLTGVDGMVGGKSKGSSSSHINRLLARPEAERTVATIIHEATHQVAFNCGLQTRYADIPLWVSEGIAVWFETPDLSSSKGWRNVGGQNVTRLTDFRRYLKRRPRDSLKTLLSSDDRFRDPKEAIDAYAEAWALNYFLFKRQGKNYGAYMKSLAEKKPLLYDQPEARLAEFETHFGKDWERLDAEFLKYFVDGK